VLKARSAPINGQMVTAVAVVLKARSAGAAAAALRGLRLITRHLQMQFQNFISQLNANQKRWLTPPLFYAHLQLESALKFHNHIFNPLIINESPRSAAAAHGRPGRPPGSGNQPLFCLRSFF